MRLRPLLARRLWLLLVVRQPVSFIAVVFSPIDGLERFAVGAESEIKREITLSLLIAYQVLGRYADAYNEGVHRELRHMSDDELKDEIGVRALNALYELVDQLATDERTLRKAALVSRELRCAQRRVYSDERHPNRRAADEQAQRLSERMPTLV